MDRDLLRRIAIAVRECFTAGPDPGDVTAAAELVRDLLGPGNGVDADGTNFRVLTVVAEGSRRRPSREADVLFWVRDKRAANLNLDWRPATWPDAAPSITVRDEGGLGTTVRYDADAVHRAALRVHATARPIVEWALDRESEKLRAYRDILAASPFEFARGTAAQIPTKPPSFAAKTRFLDMSDIVRTWLNETSAIVATLTLEQATLAAPLLHSALGSGGRTYAAARALGYDLETVLVEYVRPGGERERGRQRPVALLTHQGRPLELPPLRTEDGLRRSGAWSVRADDAISLFTDAPRILDISANPPGHDGPHL